MLSFPIVIILLIIIIDIINAQTVEQPDLSVDTNLGRVVGKKEKDSIA